MLRQPARGATRKPFVPPKLTYFGQMSEIVMESPVDGTASYKGTDRGGSFFRGWKDTY